MNFYIACSLTNAAIALHILSQVRDFFDEVDVRLFELLVLALAGFTGLSQFSIQLL